MSGCAPVRALETRKKVRRPVDGPFNVVLTLSALIGARTSTLNGFANLGPVATLTSQPDRHAKSRKAYRSTFGASLDASPSKLAFGSASRSDRTLSRSGLGSERSGREAGFDRRIEA